MQGLPFTLTHVHMHEDFIVAGICSDSLTIAAFNFSSIGDILISKISKKGHLVNSVSAWHPSESTIISCIIPWCNFTKNDW